MGKTAFALNVAQHAALRENIPVLMFSLEMSAEQIAQRMLAAESEVNLRGCSNRTRSRTSSGRNCQRLRRNFQKPHLY